MSPSEGVQKHGVNAFTGAGLYDLIEAGLQLVRGDLVKPLVRKVRRDMRMHVAVEVAVGLFADEGLFADREPFVQIVHEGDLPRFWLQALYKV